MSAPEVPLVETLAALVSSFTARRIGMATLAIAVLAGPLALASPARALVTFCQGTGCDGLAATDRGDGTAFDFVLGLDGTPDDRLIDIKTRGNVYLVGPISDDVRAKLKATTILLEGSSAGSRRVKVKARDLVTNFVADPTPDAPTGAGSDRTQVRHANGRTKVKSNGDIYLDLAGLDIRRVKIQARGAIVLDTTTLTPPVVVPEPSTVAMMLLGLAGLSLRRIQHGTR